MGGIVLSGMTVHRPTRLWIGFDITTANRFFTISGGLNPSSKLTVTRLACGGCCWIGILRATVARCGRLFAQPTVLISSEPSRVPVKLSLTAGEGSFSSCFRPCISANGLWRPSADTCLWLTLHSGQALEVSGQHFRRDQS